MWGHSCDPDASTAEDNLLIGRRQSLGDDELKIRPFDGYVFEL
jgi:hypothetical protein